ncbi:MAG TPA: hypothetical protein VEJ67_06520 [Candidatus Cybelea sp.]|nr:hypothetical protein [Candidatus Cybelea sp.]
MRLFSVIGSLAIAVSISTTVHAQASPSAAASNSTANVLKAADITPAVFPDRVFYRGKTASTQMRNTAGVHFPDDAYFLAGLVDTGGYSSAIAEKYQAYLLSEATLEIGGEELKPGAYGVGFVSGNFIVTDIGGHDLLRVPANRDMDMKRPVPLQVVPGAGADSFRLYHGRDFVEFRRGSKGNGG